MIKTGTLKRSLLQKIFKHHEERPARPDKKMPLLKMDEGQSSIHPAAGWLFFNLAHLKGVSQLSAENPTILVRWS